MSEEYTSYVDYELLLDNIYSNTIEICRYIYYDDKYQDQANNYSFNFLIEFN